MRWERLDPVRAIKLWFRLSHRTSAVRMMPERRNDPLQVSSLTPSLATLKLGAINVLGATMLI